MRNLIVSLVLLIVLMIGCDRFDASSTLKYRNDEMPKLNVIVDGDFAPPILVKPDSFTVDFDVDVDERMQNPDNGNQFTALQKKVCMATPYSLNGARIRLPSILSSTFIEVLSLYYTKI